MVCKCRAERERAAGLGDGRLERMSGFAANKKQLQGNKVHCFVLFCFYFRFWLKWFGGRGLALSIVLRLKAMLTF